MRDNQPILESQGPGQLLKILFVIPDLNGAGAQRTILNIVNHLDRSRFRPMLALYEGKGDYLDLLREDVEVINLGVSRARWAILPLSRKIRLLKPDLVFGMLIYANVVTVLASMISLRRMATVVEETNNWTAVGRQKTNIADRLTGWAYRRASRVVAPSQGIAGDCIFRYDLPTERISVIYDGMDIAFIESQASEYPPECPFATRPSGYFEIIAVGRLVKQKGFDLLVQAVAKLENLNWRLTLIGEGEERVAIQRLVSELGIEDRVSMPGFQRNPYAWMARADLFVLSSRWEGFGRVLAEAMACGVPVLATRCPSGPEEIITHGVDGVLCEPNSVADLVANIGYMASHQEEIQQYAVSARASVRRFEISTIVREYEAMFLGMIGAQDQQAL